MKDILPAVVKIFVFALLFTSMNFQSVFAHEHSSAPEPSSDEHHKYHEEHHFHEYEKKHDHDELDASAPSPSAEPFWKELLKKHKLPGFAPSPSKGLPELIVDQFHKEFAPSPSKYGKPSKKDKKDKALSVFGFFGAPISSELKKDHDKLFKSLPPLPSFSSLSPTASAYLKEKKHHFGAASPASSPTGTYKPHFKVVPKIESVDKTAKAPKAAKAPAPAHSKLAKAPTPPPEFIFVVPEPKEDAKPKDMGRKLL